MRSDPNILALNVELAAEAFDGIAFQSTALSRFLHRGDDIAALRTYGRIVALFKEFAVPAMKVLRDNLEDPDTLSVEAASEWRAQQDEAPCHGKTARAA